MPRELSDKPCEVTFYDRISDSEITLLYRLPTTEARVKYNSSLITRRGNKFTSSVGSARMKFGADILIGFKEGAFANEKGELISSDPASERYDQNWKELVKKYAPDVIESLAIVVFESSLMPDTSLDAGGEEKENPT